MPRGNVDGTFAKNVLLPRLVLQLCDLVRRTQSSRYASPAVKQGTRGRPRMRFSVAVCPQFHSSLVYRGSCTSCMKWRACGAPATPC